MAMELLDLYRGYAISAIILAFIGVGISSSYIPDKFSKIKRSFTFISGIIGGLSGFFLFFILNFISGWDEYFDSKGSADSTDYSGRHQAAASVIKTLGDMNASSLGIFFGVIGVFLFFIAYSAVKNKT